jgi:CRP/FNR family transcriptional regulator, cyclic AMP receptor protein
MQTPTSVPPPPVDFSALVRADADTETYEPEAVIISQGEPGDRMYILLEGTVIVSSDGRDIATLGPGNLFGEMCVINEEARSATVRARSAVRVVAITRKRFLFLTQQTPYFALHVMQLLSDRIRRMNSLT